MVQSAIDRAAQLLRIPGGALRGLLLQIPLPYVRVLFLALLFALVIAVLRMSRDSLIGNAYPGGKTVNLRPFILAAIGIQIVIYMTL